MRAASRLLTGLVILVVSGSGTLMAQESIHERCDSVTVDEQESEDPLHPTNVYAGFEAEIAGREWLRIERIGISLARAGSGPTYARLTVGKRVSRRTQRPGAPVRAGGPSVSARRLAHSGTVGGSGGESYLQRLRGTH